MNVLLFYIEDSSKKNWNCISIISHEEEKVSRSALIFWMRIQYSVEAKVDEMKSNMIKCLLKMMTKKDFLDDSY